MDGGRGKLLEDGKGSVGGHSTIVVFLRHEDVAVIAPVRRPGVLDQDVGLIILGGGGEREERNVYRDHNTHRHL